MNRVLAAVVAAAAILASVGGMKPLWAWRVLAAVAVLILVGLLLR
jgi:hypothetical protein